MQRLHHFTIASVIGLSSIFGLSNSVGSTPRPPLSAVLLGANEVVPAPSGAIRRTLANQGDLDGIGSATVTMTRIRNTSQARLCYGITVANIGSTIVAAHIHQADAGVNGGIVVPLTAPVGGAASGCVTIPLATAIAIQVNPLNYYVNVHTSTFPGGAVRGQLH